jgi:hypothetical protein
MVGDRNGVPPMKLSRSAFVLATSLLAAMSTHASDAVPEFIEHIPIFGKAPPTAHWIWYVIAGQKDRIAPVVYISTRHFKTISPEVLIVLPRARYNIVAHFVQERLTATNCPLEVQKPLPSYAVQILEHHGGHTRSCMISQASTCEHIAEVMKLPGMDWSPAELKILDEFARGDQCKSILNPPR